MVHSVLIVRHPWTMIIHDSGLLILINSTQSYLINESKSYLFSSLSRGQLISGQVESVSLGPDILVTFRSWSHVTIHGVVKSVFHWTSLFIIEHHIRLHKWSFQSVQTMRAMHLKIVKGSLGHRGSVKSHRSRLNVWNG